MLRYNNSIFECYSKTLQYEKTWSKNFMNYFWKMYRVSHHLKFWWSNSFVYKVIWLYVHLQMRHGTQMCQSPISITHLLDELKRLFHKNKNTMKDNTLNHFTAIRH